MARHSWEQVHSHKWVCRNCGWVKIHVPNGPIHTWTFERDGDIRSFGVGQRLRTPPCDATWPAGWNPHRAAQYNR